MKAGVLGDDSISMMDCSPTLNMSLGSGGALREDEKEFEEQTLPLPLLFPQDSQGHKGDRSQLLPLCLYTLIVNLKMNVTHFYTVLPPRKCGFLGGRIRT